MTRRSALLRVLAADNLAAYATYTGTPVETLKAMDLYQPDPNLAPDEQTLLDKQRVFIDEGVLAVGEPIAADRLVDPSFAQAAVQRLGPYTGG